MKKIFLALAAVAALAACSKSEVAYEYDREITFSAVTKNITKSMMETALFDTDEQFNVWAFYNPTTTPNSNIEAWVAEYNANTENGAKVYVDEKPFASHSDYAEWAGVTPYFWPKVGTLAFAGYYPTTMKNNVAYELTSSKNCMTLTDIQRSWVTAEDNHREDLMYFNLTQCYSGKDAAPVVTAVFKHALSWLTVNLSTTEETLGLGATITVSSVKFTEVYPSGDAVVDNQAAIAWAPDGTAGNVEVVAEPVVLDDEVAMQKEPLFIPQDMNGNLEITYTVSSPVDSEGHISSFTETKVIELATLKGWVPKVDGDGNVVTDNEGNPVLELGNLSKWEDAKHYIYNVVITTSEILIDAEVVTWDEIEIPVEY